MSFQLDFQLKDDGGDLGTYVTNGEWDLLGRCQGYSTTHSSVCVNFLHLNFLFIYFDSFAYLFTYLAG